MLDKESPVPLYIQFKEYLMEQIDRGAFAPGKRLPPERVLVEQFGVSRITVRRALHELSRDGMILSVAGKGTYVAQKPEEDFDPMISFSDQMRAQGKTPSSEVLHCAVVPALRRLARELRLPDRKQVVLLERLRRVDGAPHVLQTAYLPLDLCPGLLDHDFARDSLYRVLRETYQWVPSSAETSFEARLADDSEERHLDLDHPSAVLVMRQTSYLDNGRPIEYTRSVYRPNDRFHSMHGLIVSQPDL